MSDLFEGGNVIPFVRPTRMQPRAREADNMIWCGRPIVNTYTARPVCWCEWISDSYCSLKPLCSGMGEVVPART